MQANAEPDLQQTGSRLKPIVAGVIEGIMQLVVDPLAMTQVIRFANRTCVCAGWCDCAKLRQSACTALKVNGQQLLGNLGRHDM